VTTCNSLSPLSDSAGCGNCPRNALEMRGELRDLGPESLAAAQWVQGHDFHAAGERLVDCLNGQEICGTSEQKTARPRVFIHTMLYRKQKVRATLHLIDDRPVESANECHRIALGGCQGRLAVKSEVRATSLREAFRERSFPRLPWAADCDNPRIA
jgi:hypothetical protein